MFEVYRACLCHIRAIEQGGFTLFQVCLLKLLKCVGSSLCSWKAVGID